MALSQSGYPEVPKSITNPNVDVVNSLDANASMSFLTFIKIIDTSFNPTEIQEYYNAYLKNWNSITNSKENTNQNIIIERYREFIQDVNLEYTTFEERKFLEQLDFNDPLDLDVAIPFYSRKLIEIATYYNKKREEIKFQITKNQIGGTNFGLLREITDLTLNYLNTYDSGKILYNYNDVKNNIEVEIEELYESYPSYFNQTPNDKVYDDKDLDYGLDIFLRTNDDLIKEVFSGVSNTLKTLKESDQLFDNKRKLTEKYISTNFYYLSTGSTIYDFVSGKLFDNNNPIANFLNVNYPTTASTNRQQFVTPLEQGFFKPHKTSIILVDGENFSFSINFNNIKPNTVYYFPDPAIHGTNGEVLTFITNDLFLKRNDSSGVAKNQPTTDKKDSKYYGYISQIELPKSKYLDKIFESGYIQDSKSDTYNNLYGLFKNDGDFTQNITALPETVEPFDILNGHTFYDYLYGEGYSFNYSTFDNTTIPYTTRTGISAYTAGFTDDFSRYYTIFGGTFTDNPFYYPPGFLPDYQILDGVGVFNGDVSYIDTISSDLSAYPDSGTFYYSKLIEGGIHSSSPLQRALLDVTVPSITANATKDIKPDEIITFSIDGGRIISPFDDVISDIPTIYYDPSVIETSVFTLSADNTKNYFDRYTINGGIYIRNATDKSVNKMEDSFPYFSSTFPLSVYTDMISAVNSFEIVNDVLFIETSNYFIITKILFENGEFIDPKSTPFVISHSNNPYQKISKRYKKNNKVYYALLNVEQYPAVSSTFKIYPTIYEFDTLKYSQKTYEPNISSDFYYVSGGAYTYTKAESPVFTWGSRNNLYNISFMLKDSSNHFSLNEFDFELNPFNMLYHKQFKQ